MHHKTLLHQKRFFHRKRITVSSGIYEWVINFMIWCKFCSLTKKLHCKPKSARLAQNFWGEIDSLKFFELILALKFWSKFAQKFYVFICLLKFFKQVFLKNLSYPSSKILKWKWLTQNFWAKLAQNFCASKYWLKFLVLRLPEKFQQSLLKKFEQTNVSTKNFS